MALSLGYVTKLYKNLSTGRQNVFFDSVADDVQWMVMGIHPLAGVYNSKADFLKHKFERVARIIKGGSVIMKIDHIDVSGDTAIVEMTSTSFALNGRQYAQKFSWITRFADGLIVQVRAWIQCLFNN
jgi:uncharacterized protein